MNCICSWWHVLLAHCSSKLLWSASPVSCNSLLTTYASLCLTHCQFWFNSRWQNFLLHAVLLWWFKFWCSVSRVTPLVGCLSKQWLVGVMLGSSVTTFSVSPQHFWWCSCCIAAAVAVELMNPAAEGVLNVSRETNCSSWVAEQTWPMWKQGGWKQRFPGNPSPLLRCSP